MFDIHKFIPILLSLYYGKKLSVCLVAHWEIFFPFGYKLQIKKIPTECNYSIVHDSHHENLLSTISGNSWKIKNVLVKWMTWNYMLGYRLLSWWKNVLGNGWAENYQELMEKWLKRTRALLWVLRFVFFFS